MSLRSDSSELKVVRHNPNRDRRIKIILIVSVLILGVFAYWYGGSEANQQSDRLQLKNMTLAERAEALQEDNDQLRQRVTILESAGKIDREAANNVRILVRQLEEEKERLNKELTFYKSVMAPEDMEPGVRVAGLDLEGTEIQGKYKLRLVISQVARLNPFLKGKLTVSLTGAQGDKVTTLSLHKLAGLGESSTSLGFRYFQSFPENKRPENKSFLEFQLPEDFVPETINVAVRVQKGAVKSFEKSFEWDKELAVDVQQE